MQCDLCVKHVKEKNGTIYFIFINRIYSIYSHIHYKLCSTYHDFYTYVSYDTDYNIQIC